MYWTDGYGLNVYCPEWIILLENNDTNIYCTISCGKSDSCIHLDVYSINGWNNVRVWSIDDAYVSYATMYCNYAYSQSYIMQSIKTVKKNRLSYHEQDEDDELSSSLLLLYFDDLFWMCLCFWFVCSILLWLIL